MYRMYSGYILPATPSYLLFKYISPFPYLTVPFPELWSLVLLCDPFSLTRDISVTIWLGLSIGVTRGYTTKSHEFPFFESTQRKWFISEEQGPPSPSYILAGLLVDPFLCIPNAATLSCSNFLIAVSVLCLVEGISEPFSLSSSSSPTPFSTVFFEL